MISYGMYPLGPETTTARGLPGAIGGIVEKIRILFLKDERNKKSSLPGQM